MDKEIENVKGVGRLLQIGLEVNAKLKSNSQKATTRTISKVSPEGEI